MFVEFQIASSAFLRLVTARLRARSICVVSEITVLGETFLVDHIEVDDTGSSIQRTAAAVSIVAPNGPVSLPGVTVEIRQPVTIHVVGFNTLAANGKNPSVADIPLHVAVFVSVTVEIVNGQASLRFKVSGTDPGVIEKILPGAGATILNTIQYNQAALLDLSGLATLLPGVDLTVLNAGVSTDQNGNFLSIRVQLGTQQNVIEFWSAYYANSTNLVAVQEWCILIDQELLRVAIVNKLQGGLSGGKFQLESGISASWGAGPTPGFHVSFSGEVINACNCFGTHIDLDVDIDINISFSVPTPGIFRVAGAVSHDSSDLELFCCELTAALFWPIIGGSLLAGGEISWGSFIGGLALGPVGVFIGAVAYASGQGARGLNPGESCQQPDDDHFFCDSPASIDSGSVVGRLTPTVLSGPAEGVLLGGALAGGRAILPPKLNCSGSDSFAWTIVGGCGEGFGIAPLASFTLTNAGQGPIRPCEAKLLDDPLDAYQMVFTPNGYYSGSFVGTIDISPSPSAAFLANPYPCRILVKTSAGARLLTLAPPQDLTVEQKGKLDSVISKLKGKCFEIIDNWTREMVGINPKWLVDPPILIGIDRYAHLWQIVGTKVLGSERVEVFGQDGLRLVTSAPNRTGVASVTALFEGRPKGDELELRLSKGQRVGIRASPTLKQIKKSLFIKQTLLIQRVVIHVGEPCRGLRMFLHRGDSCLEVVTTDGTCTFDVSSPLFAPLLDRSPSTFILRDCKVPRREAEALVHQIACDHGLPLPSIVAFAPSGIAWLAEGTLTVLNTSSFVISGTFKGRSLVDVVWVGRRLAVLESQAVLLFKSEGEKVIRQVTSFQLEAKACVGLAVPRVPGRTRALFVPAESGGGQLLDFENDRGVEAARFHQRPWFDGATRCGNLLARRGDANSQVTVYEVAQSRTA